MAVLTSQPRGATWQSSVARITALTKEVYRAGVRGSPPHRPARPYRAGGRTGRMRTKAHLPTLGTAL